MREMAVLITLCLLLRAPWSRLTWTGASHIPFLDFISCLSVIIDSSLLQDLGENQLSNIDQQLVNPVNPAKDVEDIGVLGWEALLNHQMPVQVRESRSCSTLELALLNPTESNPSMFGMLTSPPTEGIPRSDHVIICAS
ncbi:hypothetical protein RchiOBHm_Chr5g0053911 [Rosa chinensis]|uniref:Uncharacterized protein n=1 Tax=Rosa chinensis TaxID=74649 RepID=A0A2P6QG06_ROSCH|nr:hypothetical protein RchiOBHm_Chr5g0053911 [Rosa chinensis]